jgi:hypothetical protein
VASKATFEKVKAVGKSFGRRSFFFDVLEMRVDNHFKSGRKAVAVEN